MLSHFALFSAQDEDGEYNVVKVMTIHTSKGLEFDTVFVPVDCINNSRILIKGETEQMLPKLKFDVGDIVRHKVFGVGEIIKIDNITQTYEIRLQKIYLYHGIPIPTASQNHRRDFVDFLSQNLIL